MKIKTKKGNTLAIAMIVFIVAITAGVIGWMFARKTQVEQLQQNNEIVSRDINKKQTSVEQVENKNQVEDETADWQIYTNEKNGYQIKFPKDWKTVDTKSPNTFALNETNSDRGYDAPSYDFSISYYENISQEPENIANKLNSKNLNEFIKNNILLSDAKQINFAGQNAWEAIRGGMTASYVLFIERNEHIYEIAFGNKTNKFELFNIEKKVISTFKFIDLTANEAANCENGNKVFFEVKELGIKFLVEKSIKDDLIYKYIKPTRDSFKGDLGGVTFSTKSLTALDSDCSTQWSPVGMMEKIKGKPSDYANDQGLDQFFNARLIKQFNNFFVGFSGPQATCGNQSNIEKTTDLANQLREKIYLKDSECILSL